MACVVCAELDFVSGSALANRKILEALKENTYLCIKDCDNQLEKGVLFFDSPTGVPTGQTHQHVSFQHLAVYLLSVRMLALPTLPQRLIRKGDVVLVREKCDQDFST